MAMNMPVRPATLCRICRGIAGVRQRVAGLHHSAILQSRISWRKDHGHLGHLIVYGPKHGTERLIFDTYPHMLTPGAAFCRTAEGSHHSPRSPAWCSRDCKRFRQFRGGQVLKKAEIAGRRESEETVQ